MSKLLNKSLLTKLLGPVVVAIMLYWVYQKVDVDVLLVEIKNANYFWVVLAAFAGMMSHFIRAVRWKMLIEAMGYQSRLKTSFAAVMVGYMVNYLTPRMGEIVRCGIKNRRDDVPMDELMGTVVTERVFDLIITAIITFIALLIQFDIIGSFLMEQFDTYGGNYWVKIIALLVLMVMGVGGWFIYKQLRNAHNITSPIIKKLIDFVEGILRGAKSIMKLKRPGLFVVYSLLIWLGYFMVSYLVFFAVDATSNLGIDAAITTLIVATIAVIIPAPGGLGSFHYFVPLGLTLYGIEINAGTSYATISHASQMIMIFVIGAASLILLGFEKRKEQRKQASGPTAS